MDNPVTIATLGTQDTGQGQTKQNATQCRKLPRWATRTHQKPGVNPGAREGYAVPASYNASVVLLIDIGFISTCSLFPRYCWI